MVQEYVPQLMSFRKSNIPNDSTPVLDYGDEDCSTIMSLYLGDSMNIAVIFELGW
jgi:hypothetical protein